jgi:hypothetical protein
VMGNRPEDLIWKIEEEEVLLKCRVPSFGI